MVNHRSDGVGRPIFNLQSALAIPLLVYVIHGALEREVIGRREAAMIPDLC